MKTLSRKLALTQLAINMIIQYPTKEIENILFADYLDEHGQSLTYTSIFDGAVQTFLLDYFIDIKLKGYSNHYLKKYISDLYNEPITIIGDEDILYICPCCSYLTLEHQGQYDVCPLCSWEDDGTLHHELDKYSVVNHSTLKQYKGKFEKQKVNFINIPYKSGNDN
ncbi:hypothetical protein A9G45_09065 [Gilliamella sp. HK2]|jgi:rubrerythrin|uniref:CPCC family cysteine-rich protein n=1 Tax=unclassified Gilliamella TaxID=2685620 RepID=UPI00080DF9B1|nr:CPCC family cysteine-rich protein [Gilliamella apicola]OCG24499.1 hypothetical protein A9G46_08590 [Gilliamella apicola]OCG27501.1 hypothetical protein A9G45_09065 [Gilliamella apicola]